jgi:hypothetical protein
MVFQLGLFDTPFALILDPDLRSRERNFLKFTEGRGNAQQGEGQATEI